MKNQTLISAFVAALVCSAIAATAAAAAPRELFRSPFLTPTGGVAKLAAGVTYAASDFPLGLRVTTPDGSWLGAQFKGDSSFQHKKSTVAPFYGWVNISENDTAAGPFGMFTIVTPYGKTSSVAATVARLRTGGHGATFDASSPVKLAGYSGVQFDGQAVGKEHAFIPFTAKTNAGMWHPDSMWVAKGEVFRIIVLGVRGKTVVLLIENAELPADQFPDFLTRADKILNTLKFPA